jgi:hypothetical protein
VRDAIPPQRFSHLTDQHRAHRPENNGAQGELSDGKYPAEGRYAGLWSHRSDCNLAFFPVADNSQASGKIAFFTPYFVGVRKAMEKRITPTRNAPPMVAAKLSTKADQNVCWRERWSNHADPRSKIAMMAMQERGSSRSSRGAIPGRLSISPLHGLLTAAETSPGCGPRESDCFIAQPGTKSWLALTASSTRR